MRAFFVASDSASLAEYSKNLNEQVVQLVYFAKFSYRDLLSMEISERMTYYREFIEIRKKENDQSSDYQQQHTPNFNFRPDLSKVPRFN